MQQIAVDKNFDSTPGKHGLTQAVLAFRSRAKAKKEIKRFTKFGLVGFSGAAIDFGILNCLIFIVGWSNPLGKLLANLISTTVAIGNNFVWHRFWTFPESQVRNGQTQLIQFALVSLIGLSLNTTIFYLSNQFIFEPILATTWAVQLAKVTASMMVLFWNFGANRLWTYRGL